MSFFQLWRVAGLMFAVTALAGTASAVTVTVNGAATVPQVSYLTLSEAVAYTNSAGAGPHTINVVTDSITDGQFANISQPVTINGDGNNNTIPCDVLVDIAGLTGAASGLSYYIRVASAGDVTIRDLNIHPDELGVSTFPIGAIETDNPVSGLSNYLLQNVQVSGTNGTSFVDPITELSLYDDPANILWVPAPTEDSPDGGIVRIANTSGTLSAAGDYNVTLEQCSVAMGVSMGLNIDGRSNGGQTTILGGLYGHVARHPIGLRGGSRSVTIKGTYENRVQLLRGNYGNSGSHIALADSSTVELMEYVDSHLFEINCWGINLSNNATLTMRHCRVWHGIDPYDAAAPTGGRLIRGPSNSILNADRCTFFVDNCANTNGDNNANHDLHVLITDCGAGHDGLFTFTDCVFASDGPAGPNVDGYFNIAGAGPYTFNNCGIPTDDYIQENLRLAPYPFAPPTDDTTPANVVLNSIVSVSPHFSDIIYDISDPSNATFLLPTDPAYTGAASDGEDLVGGVGFPTVAGIDDWMLMEI